MGNSNMANFFKSAQQSLIKHTPEILIGSGVTGMLVATVLAVKATTKAVRLVDQKKKEVKQDKLTPKDVVKATWKCYIPTVGLSLVSASCILCGNHKHLRRNAVLATAYKLSETALLEYKDKVVETIGEKKERQINEKVASDRAERVPASQNAVYLTDKGDTLFLDSVSNRLFKSDIELIRKAVNTVNYEMTHDIMGYVSLSDFYDEIGLEHTSISDDIGWNLDNGAGLLEVDFYPAINEGKPCIVLDYSVAPKYGYMSPYSA